MSEAIWKASERDAADCLSGRQATKAFRSGKEGREQHRGSPDMYDVLDAEKLMSRLHSARGPGQGMGCGAGRPWRGIVEETACLWVGWIVEGARRAGMAAPRAVEVNGQRVRLVTAELTFGKRYYFECPRCGRRIEALYFLGRECGCRKCLRLGYRSQTSRPGSPWGYLDWVFHRRSLWRRWDLPDNLVCNDLVGALEEAAGGTDRGHDGPGEGKERGWRL